MSRSRAGGFAILYFMFMWTAFVGVCSLAVDFGRVSLVKSQLQCAADAAARAALFNLPSGGVTGAQNAAVAIAAANYVDGSSVVINPNTDIIFGTWNSTTQTFTTLTGSQQSSATAVQVNVQHSAARGNPVPLLFASVIGQSTCDVRASSTVCAATSINLTNPSFESPALSYGNYAYDQAMPGWTLTSYACLETYGSAWSSPQPSGNQAVALQGGYGAVGTISQSFTAINGTYSVSCIAAQRTAYYIGSTPLQPVSVKIDGTQVGLISPTDGTFRTYTTPTFSLTSGTHTLLMSATDNTTDKTTFVDSIAINCSNSGVVLAK